MELEGCKRSFQFLKQLGLSISLFFSDRHRSIEKSIRKSCPSTKHYFDIWHVARTIIKKLLKASKEKGCEVISSWIRGIRKHQYWCATSSKSGFGSLISAKWYSLQHVSNQHKNHGSKLVISKLLLLPTYRMLWYAEQTVFLLQHSWNSLEIHILSCILDTCTHIQWPI